jgi:hypothetical protein
MPPPEVPPPPEEPPPPPGVDGPLTPPPPFPDDELSALACDSAPVRPSTPATTAAATVTPTERAADRARSRPRIISAAAPTTTALVVAAGMPLIFEVAFLFDLLVAVVVFGLLIRVHHGRADSLSTAELTRLRG